MMKILGVYGTRPEKLKLDPVLNELEDRGHDIERWWSRQSPDLVHEDETYVSDPMTWRDVRDGISNILEWSPVGGYDCVLVVGDTATAFAGAVAGFLAEVPVGHIEAGLRTYGREPWPEEAFRQSIRTFASFHFCPDEWAADNIRYEDTDDIDIWNRDKPHGSVFVTGNTSIDALDGPRPIHAVATFHRRENWGRRIENALEALHDAAEDDLFHPWVFTHPNWTKALTRPLEAFSNIHFCDPTSHDVFLDEIAAADLVITDSGGVQEEAAAIGTDCYVYRTSTERTALEESGAVELVDPRNPSELRDVLSTEIRQRTAYGRGDAAEKIVDILEEELE